MAQYLSPGVYVEEVDSGVRPIEGVGTAVAAFVGLTASGPLNTPTLVSNWTQFVNTFTDSAEATRIDGQVRAGLMDEDEAGRRKAQLQLDPFVPGAYLPHAVYGYFMNGGGNAYIVRLGRDSTNGKRTGDGLPSAYGELPAETDAKSGPPYRVRAKTPGTTGNELTVEVTHPAPPADQGEEGGSSSPETFDLTVRRGGQVAEQFTGLTTKRGKQNATTVVREQSQLVELEELLSGAALQRPAAGAIELAGGAAPALPAELGAPDFIGDVATRTGTGGLETIEDITMVCAPDLMGALERELIDLPQFQAVQLAMIAHCELMGDRMAILDPPPGLNAQEIKQWRLDAGYDSKYATLYWPRPIIADPATGQLMPVPPCGHIAGVWARNDDERGVHKAPANEVLRGVVDLELNITKREHDLLNPENINAIRAFPGRGIRVWGARTLSSDPAWRYLNVRRLFNYLEKSILTNTDWVVFEPNDRALWAKIRRTISSFLVLEWRKGALFGSTPAEAYFVKCDDETNPAEAIDAGQVMCQIGVAPVKPAEFVIFQLAQMQGGVSLVTE
jgi:uncharacterized protein